MFLKQITFFIRITINSNIYTLKNKLPYISIYIIFNPFHSIISSKQPLYLSLFLLPLLPIFTNKYNRDDYSHRF